jgi:hypothetical protein
MLLVRTRRRTEKPGDRAPVCPDLLAGLVLESGHQWADGITDWQDDDARAVLADDAVRRHYLCAAAA